MRKFAAVPTNSIVAMHAVTASSLRVASTRRSKMRDLCSRWRLAIHTKKICPPIRPRMISSGAGEMPRMSNGA